MKEAVSIQALLQHGEEPVVLDKISRLRGPVASYIAALKSVAHLYSGFSVVEMERELGELDKLAYKEFGNWMQHSSVVSNIMSTYNKLDAMQKNGHEIRLCTIILSRPVEVDLWKLRVEDESQCHRVTQQLLRASSSAWEILISPSIDVEKCASTFLYILKLCKDNVSRCDAAFALLEKAVNKLRDNFGEYSKAAFLSGSPAAVLSLFIQDTVSGMTTYDVGVKITNQMQSILRFMVKQCPGISAQDIKTSIMETQICTTAPQENVVNAFVDGLYEDDAASSPISSETVPGDGM
ncbi:MAG TPA: hypothetical protein VFQ26_06160 [Nitrospiraceae bacterium]|nr:hypothetical protein [Nitrospiraceae bacterium]